MPASGPLRNASGTGQVGIPPAGRANAAARSPTGLWQAADPGVSRRVGRPVRLEAWIRSWWWVQESPAWRVRARSTGRGCRCDCSTGVAGSVGGWPPSGSTSAPSTSGRRTSPSPTRPSSRSSRTGASGGSRSRGPTASRSSTAGRRRPPKRVRCAGGRRARCARSSRTWPTGCRWSTPRSRSSTPTAPRAAAGRRRAASAVALAMPDAQAGAAPGPRPCVDSAEQLDRPSDPVIALAAWWDERTWDAVSPDGRFEAAFVNGDDASPRSPTTAAAAGDDAPVLVAHSTPELAAAAPGGAGPGRAADARRAAATCSTSAEPVGTHVHRWSLARPADEREGALPAHRRARRRLRRRLGPARPRSRPRGSRAGRPGPGGRSSGSA